MGIKQKMMMIVGISFFLCIGAYIIITNMFSNLEKQLFERCRIEAHIGSKSMSEMMEIMIQTKILNENDLFDSNYIEIKGILPKIYHTKYDMIFDRFIQKFEDIFLFHDKDLVYALLVDKNGYAPTHNSAYSKPPKADEMYNLKYSRSKRMFNDKVGLKAARYDGKETVEQFYPRDTGETIWDIAVPVFVKDKHWGAFRVGVSFNGIEKLKNQMMLIIIMTIFVIVTITLLVLFLAIPRKFTDSDLNLQKY